jgi:thiamine phosphate synthase YjbQ (UPF0047 family)
MIENNDHGNYYVRDVPHTYTEKLETDNAALRELNEKLSDDLVKTIEKCAPEHEELAGYKEENDLQRDSIQQLSAQVAGYRNILKVIHAGCTPFLKTSDLAKDIAYACYKALSNPDPGAEIMDRMKKLEAVAEAAKELLNLPTTSSHIGTWEGIILHDDILERMSDALADLEGDAHE